MPLTEIQCRQAKAKEKTYLLSDGKGLSLEVRPNGKKYWIARLWNGGKESRRSVGSYPDVSLREAREQNSAIRKSPPPTSTDTFAAVAKEWYERKALLSLSSSYRETIRLRLDKHILPELGGCRISDMTTLQILQFCRRIEDRGTVETAHRVCQIIGQVFRYGIASGRVENDPTVAMRGALMSVRVRHFSTITDPKAIGDLMRRIDGYKGSLVRCAMQFSALTFCRPGEVRRAEWSEIEEDTWKIGAEKMKMGRPHIIPLARQTINLLANLKTLTGDGRWLFPSARNDGRCMSENTVRVALRSLGYENNEMTPHGFRSMASTVLNEHGFQPDVIERQLAHAEKNSIRAAYNHAEYLPQRRELMQWWADFLDNTKLK